MDETVMGVPLDGIAHIIQVALTPVFLLTGIVSLLNVVTLRLAQVEAQAGTVAASLRAAQDASDNASKGTSGRVALATELDRAYRRLWALDAARTCGAMAGISTCGATFTLFIGGLRNATVATALFVLFGLAVLGTVLSLLGLLVEVSLSWRRPAGRRAAHGP